MAVVSAEVVVVDEFRDASRLTSKSEASPWYASVCRRNLGNQISVGETTYPLRRDLPGTSFTVGSDLHKFRCDAISGIVGEGTNDRSAFIAWRENLHCEFQLLFAKRTFELNDHEKSRWQALSRVIDVDAYKNANPIQLRQFGEVTSNRPGQVQVQWENGLKQRIDLTLAPAEFAALSVGQPIEAIVVFHRMTGNFIRISSVRRCQSTRRRTSSEAESLWNSIQTSIQSPDAPLQDF